MFNMFKKKKQFLVSPVTGTIVTIDQVNDEVFSSKMMGDGFAVKPDKGDIYSPCDGTVISVFKTKHALTVETVDGLEIIIHVGLDTVELKGEGFMVHVVDGQGIKAGDLLMTVDLDYLMSQNKDTIIPVVISNMERVKSLEINEGACNQGDQVLTYQ